MNYYKIKNSEGKYFKKVLNGMWNIKNGLNYKISEWDDNGRIFDEKELSCALNALTTIAKPTKIRPYPIYPSYSIEELEVLKIFEK